MKKALFVIMVVAIAMLVGCATPEQKAQKLFDQGKYAEILAQYANLPIAAEAKNKLAEGLFNEGKFEEVLKTYPESPVAPQAKNKLAEKLFNEGKYDDVIAQYGDTPFAMQAKDMKAKADFDVATKEKKKDVQKKMLEDIVAKYAGTPTAANAQQMIDDMSKKGGKAAKGGEKKAPAKKMGKK